MKILESYIEKTNELLAYLEKGLPKKSGDKDAYIKSIEQLLGERRDLLNKMPDLTDLEDQTKQELVNLEKKLQLLLKNQKESAKEDIKILKKKKQNYRYYSNPYQNVNFDGTFFDKKK